MVPIEENGAIPFLSRDDLQSFVLVLGEGEIRRFDTIFAFIVGTLPVLAVAYVSFAFLINLAAAQDGVNIEPDMLYALANSILFGFAAALLGIVPAFVTTMNTKNRLPTIALALSLLFVPGQLLTMGLDFGSAGLWHAGAESLKPYVLLISLAAYVLPFQIIVLLSSFDQVDHAELMAARELMSTAERARYLLKRVRSGIGSAIAIGVALASTENVRSAVLATDFWGLGSKFLSPYFSTRYNSGGFSHAYFVLSIFLFTCAAIILTNKLSLAKVDR